MPPILGYPIRQQVCILGVIKTLMDADNDALFSETHTDSHAAHKQALHQGFWWPISTSTFHLHQICCGFLNYHANFKMVCSHLSLLTDLVLMTIRNIDKYFIENLQDWCKYAKRNCVLHKQWISTETWALPGCFCTYTNEGMFLRHAPIAINRSSRTLKNKWIIMYLPTWYLEIYGNNLHLTRHGLSRKPNSSRKSHDGA